MHPCHVTLQKQVITTYLVFGCLCCSQGRNNQCPLRETLDELLVLKPKIDAVLSLKEAVVELKNFEKYVQYLSSAYDTVMIQTKESDSALKSLKTQALSLTATGHSQSNEIVQLLADVDRCEQYSRLSNLQLHGLPFSPEENLQTAIADVARKLGIIDF